ncbi:hypothetical protein ACGFNU_38945 [Spirillospora sp. NPDC048911]|uniref:SecDF P1 head subdomain-containing protein n=1 Tax=Spirillospora sp. NPDC048911 TaxID=3364527 RepID=UPI0037106DC0
MAQPPAPPPAPQPPTGRRTVIALVAVLIVLIGGVIIFVLLSDDSGGDDVAVPIGRGKGEPPASSGPVDLREPLTFTLLAGTSSPPCKAPSLASGNECVKLGPDALTVRRLEKVAATPPNPAQGSSTWTVSITLTSADTSGFTELTRKAAEAFNGQFPAGRMAMLIGGSLVSEPAQVATPITGGEVQISGPPSQFTQAYTETLVHRLIGR